MRSTAFCALLTALMLTTACGDDGNPSPGGEGDNNPPNNQNTPDAGDNNPQGDTGPGDDDAMDMGPEVNFPQGGPNDLVDHAELLDPTTLDLQIDIESTGTIQAGAATAYLVSFTFMSQTYAGNIWRHQADLYMPIEGASDVMGIIQRGTENPVDRVSDNANFTTQWVIATAVNTGSPIMVLNDVPARMDLTTAALAEFQGAMEPRCTGGPQTQPDIITRCLFQVVHASGDASLDPLLHTGIAFVRAITATQALPALLSELSEDLGEDQPPAFTINKAALFASSFRGAALPIAAAIDKRVVGVYQSSSAFGALEEYFALQKTVWAEGYPQGDPTAWENFLGTAPGRDYMDKLDPARWPPELLAGKVFLNAWGTQMTWSPLRAFNLYKDKLPAETHTFPVIDYSDGLGSRTHLGMWQTFMLMARGERGVPRITTTFRDDRGNISVSADVQGSPDGTVGDVIIFFVSRHRDRDDLDFRDAVWQSVGTEPKDGGFSGSFTPTSRNTAYVVLATDISAVEPVTEGFLTSDVTIVEP